MIFMKNKLNYFYDDSLKVTDDEKWYHLIDMVINKSDSVEFNILYKNIESVPEIKNLSHHLIEKGKRKNKIFSSGEYLKFHLKEEMKDFIRSMKYSEGFNYYIEDISFIESNVEILATITHENYVIMLLSENQKNDLNKQGYNFIFYSSPDDFPDECIC